MRFGIGSQHVSAPLALPQIPVEVVSALVTVERATLPYAVGGIDPDPHRAGCISPGLERATSFEDERRTRPEPLEVTGASLGPVPSTPAADRSAPYRGHEGTGEVRPR